MTISNALAGLAVSDHEASKFWYQEFFGRSADFEPMPVDAEWAFPDGGQVQVFADRERAGHCSITLAVDDLEAEISRLNDRGVSVGPIEEGEAFRIAIVTDPDGNQIVLSQEQRA